MGPHRGVEARGVSASSIQLCLSIRLLATVLEPVRQDGPGLWEEPATPPLTERLSLGAVLGAPCPDAQPPLAGPELVSLSHQFHTGVHQ